MVVTTGTGHAQSADLEGTSDEALVEAAEKLTQANPQAADQALDQAPESTPSEAAAAKPKEAKAESEIPLFAQKEEVTKTEGRFIWRLLASMGFIVIIGGVMIFAGRKWSAQRNKGGEKTRIELMHQFQLGPKRSLALIRVAGETLLVGCTDHSVNLIKSVSLIDENMEEVLGRDFNNFLEDEFTISDVRTGSSHRA